jgi:hypothetical protein
MLVLRYLERARAIKGLQDLMALVLQMPPQQVVQLSLVFDDQNRCQSRSFPARSRVPQVVTQARDQTVANLCPNGKHASLRAAAEVRAVVPRTDTGCLPIRDSLIIGR